MNLPSTVRSIDWGASLRLVAITLAGMVLAAGWFVLYGDGSWRARISAGLAAAAVPVFLGWPRLARIAHPRRVREQPLRGLASGSLDGLARLRRIGAI